MSTRAKRLRSVTASLLVVIVIPIALQVWSDAKKEQGTWHPVDWWNALIAALASRWTLGVAGVSVGLFVGVRVSDWARRRDAGELRYLVDRETPLAVAARSMSLNSAYGLGIRTPTKGEEELDEVTVAALIAAVIQSAVMNGTLTLKGRPRSGVELESVSRDFWGLAAIEFEVRDTRRAWITTVTGNHKVDPARLAKLRQYDEFLVDSLEFERLWPEA